MPPSLTVKVTTPVFVALVHRDAGLDVHVGERMVAVIVQELLAVLSMFSSLRVEPFLLVICFWSARAEKRCEPVMTISRMVARVWMMTITFTPPLAGSLKMRTLTTSPVP